MMQNNERITPEQQTVENNTENIEEQEEKTNEKREEVSVVQEQPTATQPVVQSVQADDQNDDQADQKPADEAEIREELSSKIEKGEKIWEHQVKTVIKENEKDPYREEEAAEDLQVKYLDQRFGVKINKKEHDIK